MLGVRSSLLFQTVQKTKQHVVDIVIIL